MSGPASLCTNPFAQPCTGDTLTYTLGAMRPETAKADVITADAVAKQVALNKVSHNFYE